VQELNVKLGRVVDELTTQLGRSPRVDELARVTETSPEQVVEALESSRAYSALSLSERGDDSDDEGGDPLDLLGDEDEGFELVENRQMLREGFRSLADRERTILHMRFFLGLTQSDIADRVGISQMHVSRLIRQSVDQVRDELDTEPAAPRPCTSHGRRRGQPGRRSARVRAAP
jgi:RNA polymerase sigma-B factor